MAKIKSFGIQVFIGTQSVGGLKSVELPEVEVTDVDLTTHDTSGGHRQFTGGLKDGGTVTLSGAFDIDDEGQLVLQDADVQGEPIQVTIIFSDGSIGIFNAIVKGYGTSNPLDEDVTFSSSIRITGPIYYGLRPQTITVTGTLTDGTDPVVFPSLAYSTQQDSRPLYVSGDYSVESNSSEWQIIWAGAGDAEWTSSEDVPFPHLVTTWTPSSPATGTPVVKFSL